MDALSILALAKASKGGGGGSTPAVHIYTLTDAFQNDLNNAVQTCVGTILQGGDTDAVVTSLTPGTADKFAVANGVEELVNNGIVPCYYALNTNFIPASMSKVGTLYEVQFAIPFFGTNINGTEYYFNINIYVSNQTAMVHVHKAG